MSVTTASNRVVATGDSATVTFPFNRMLYDATHLQVYLDGTLQVSGYTVAGVPGTSTSITFSVAPVTGVQVLMLRVVPTTQLSIYNVGGAFPAATTEKNFDLTVMGLQQFDETLDRAVTLPVSSTLTATTFPDPADPVNFGRGVKIKGDGTGLDVFDILPGATSGIVTTKGDLHGRSATAEDRIAVGANNTVLVANSAAGMGVNWSASLSGLTLTSPVLSGTLTGTYTLGGTPTITSITGTITLVTGQLAFPATQNPSANVNTLDDYEEGTWTPNVNGTATYTTQTGTYVKIGKLVYINCTLVINVIGTGFPDVIAGLPFTCGQTAALSVGVNTSLATSVVSLRAQVTNAQQNIELRGRTAASTGSDTTSNILGSGTTIVITGCYTV